MLQIMEKKRISNKMAHLDKAYFYYGTSAVLLNRVPSKVFHCQMSIRQGDPLSPLFFVLAADFLQTLFNVSHVNRNLTFLCPFKMIKTFLQVMLIG